MGRKKKTDESKIINTTRINSGYVIIFISIICLMITIFSGGIWFSGLDLTPKKEEVALDISGKSRKASIDNEIDTDQIFEDTYYKALNVLSNTIAYGSTWLEICPNSQIDLNGKVLLKTCSEDYKTKNDIVEYLKSVATEKLISFMMGDYYIDYGENTEDSLYIDPVSTEADSTYIDVDSFEVISKSNTRIEYLVTSIYGDRTCEGDCNYDFKSHKFVVINDNGNWLVDEMEFPA